MRLLDRLVFKDLIGPFINGLFMFLMLLFAATYLFPATELIVHGVPIKTVLLLGCCWVPSLLTQTFPMAMLLASLLGMGRISSDSELVAIFAAGVSYPRVTRSVVILGTLTSIAAFFWNDLVVPPASDMALRIRKEAEKHLRDTDMPMSYEIDGKSGVAEYVKIDGGFDSRTRTLRRVTITKYSEDPKRSGRPGIIIYCRAAKAQDQKGLNWSYFDGWFAPFSPGPDGKIDDFLVVNFKELKSLPRGATVGKRFEEILANNRDDPNTKSYAQLRREIERDRAKGLEVGGKEVDLYGKIALPLASLVFGVVGAALGKTTQRGSGKTVGFGMAIFIVFLYWIFYHSMYVVGQGGSFPPLVASFLPDIVGAIIGIMLTYRASR